MGLGMFGTFGLAAFKFRLNHFADLTILFEHQKEVDTNDYPDK